MRKELNGLRCENNVVGSMSNVVFLLFECKVYEH